MPEAFSSFLKQTAQELAAKNSKMDISPELKAVYLAFLEDQDEVMGYIAKLIGNNNIDQHILDEFIEKIGRLGDIINSEKNKEPGQLEENISHNQQAKKILDELAQPKYKRILDALKKF